MPDCSEKRGSPLALPSWSVKNPILLLLSEFSGLLLSILISLASLLCNPGVFRDVMKELLSPPRCWCSLIQFCLLHPNYISSGISEALCWASPTLHLLPPYAHSFCSSVRMHNPTWILWFGVFFPSLKQKKASRITATSQKCFLLWSCWLQRELHSVTKGS